MMVILKSGENIGDLMITFGFFYEVEGEHIVAISKFFPERLV